MWEALKDRCGRERAGREGEAFSLRACFASHHPLLVLPLLLVRSPVQSPSNYLHRRYRSREEDSVLLPACSRSARSISRTALRADPSASSAPPVLLAAAERP